MSVLFINESGVTVGLQEGQFVVRKNDAVLRFIPVRQITAITLFGNSTLTTPCIKYCLLKGICVNYFSGKGKYFGRLSPAVWEDPSRLKAQIEAYEDSVFRLEMARTMISAKIHNQEVVLKRYMKSSDMFEKKKKALRHLEIK